MKHFLLTFALCLISSAAPATFEIADPANEMYEEWRATPRVDEYQSLESVPLCVLDTEVDRCWCFDRETGDQLDLTPEECRDRAAMRSDTEDR